MFRLYLIQEEAKPSDANVLLHYDALRVMAWCKRSLVQYPGEIGPRLPVSGLIPIDCYLVIDLDGDVLALDCDVIGVPFTIFGELFLHILDTIKAPALAPVAVRLVDLHFVAILWPVQRLILGVNIDSPV